MRGELISVDTSYSEVLLINDEVRFCVYKATRRGDEIYIPRSLDVTELELIKESIREKVFSEEFIEMLKQEINKI
ncbi:hypothetical protein [Clostridium sp. 1001271B_151109_B4]|uniref:hypothetical protein n=1 Tax=Clostridium sp. 1001271B_151109_B4 TaxID=2787148 RepID=UPI0018A8A5A8|nr:hypothetical protein [Clostridium sp. 1001271B_151109_B4]